MRSTKLGCALIGAVAMLALCLPGGAAASTPGDPVEPEFNYAGLYIGTVIAGDFDMLVLKPPMSPAVLHGIYSDSEGNFTVAENGFDFPSVTLDLAAVSLEGNLGLAGPGTGHYDETTGAMDLDLDLALTIGTDDVTALGEEIGEDLGSGPLACELSPIAAKLSTSGGWPHLGKAYENREGLVDGALAGAWGNKPAAVATVGDQSVCNLIAGLIKPVGGIWLANSSTPLVEMPPPDPPKCPPQPFASPYLSCYPPEDDPCLSYGRCLGEGRAAGLSISPRRANIRAGSTRQLTIGLRNSGEKPLEVKLRLGSSNPRVRLRKSLTVTIEPGKSIRRKVTVKAGAKARGRARISVSTSGLSAGTTLTVKGPAKRR